MIHTVKGFSIVSEAEVDVFLGFSCFLYDPADVGNLISGSFAFSKFSLYIWKSSVLVLLPSLKDFEHYFASMWKECNCVVVWTFFGIALLWDWNEDWPFPDPWPLLSFPYLLSYLTASYSFSWISSIMKSTDKKNFYIRKKRLESMCTLKNWYIYIHMTNSLCCTVRN